MPLALERSSGRVFSVEMWVRGDADSGCVLDRAAVRRVVRFPDSVEIARGSTAGGASGRVSCGGIEIRREHAAQCKLHAVL